MDSQLKRLYARAIDTPSGPCFSVISWGDVDTEGFDVTLFHARSLRTYARRGLRAPSSWIKPDLWLPLAQRALAQEAPPEGVPFDFNPSTGMLSWTWPARELGIMGDAVQAVQLQTVAAPPGCAAPPELEAMLGTVWESCYALLVSCQQLDGQLARQSDSLTRTRQELQECTEKHKGLVEDLHIKFARVLDAKKDKLIEQRNRLEALEAELEAARRELKEAEAIQTDNEEAEEEAAAGPAAAAAPASEATAAAALPGPAHPAGPSWALGGPGAVVTGPAPSTATSVAAPLRRLPPAATGGGVEAARAGGWPAVDGNDPMELDRPAVQPRPGQEQPETAGGASALCVAAGAGGVAAAPAPMHGGGAAAAGGGLSYQSLRNTPLDDDLMLAATQPAPFGEPLLPPPQPLRPAQEQRPAGVSSHRTAVEAGGTRGLGHQVAAPDSGEEDDEDDDAALGLRPGR